MRYSPNMAGFTLLELLVVIGIIAILAGIIIAAPLDRINQAGDTVVQNDIDFYGRATEAFATSHKGFYPAGFSDLYDANEISKMPKPPDGYTYTFTSLPNGCSSGISCTSVVLSSQLKWTRNLTKPYLRYESASGRTCQVSNSNTPCP